MAGRVGDEEAERFNLKSSCSDSGSVIDGPVSEKFQGFSSNGMLRLEEEGNEHILWKHRFYSSIGSLSQHCSIVAAYRNLHSSPMGRARLGAFRIFLTAMAEKRGGNSNVTHAWFGASKDRVLRIMNDGFDVCGTPDDAGVYGFGVHLYPEHSAIDSVLSAPVDGDGLRHLVVCRVILGSTEEILPGSRQSGPSSENFDSGVDNQQCPRRYIVWYPDVNMYILPLYALSVKLDFRSRGLSREPRIRPTSPWIPFSTLIAVLSKSLPPSTMCLIKRLHNDFMERKITRQQFKLRVRKLSGDGLLVSAIKTFRDKKMRGANVTSLKEVQKLWIGAPELTSNSDFLWTIGVSVGVLKQSVIVNNVVVVVRKSLITFIS